MAAFGRLGLDEWLVKQCKSLHLKKPSPIQENCVPPILEGRDCIGCAKTGSGKTAAFALPILQKLSEDPFGIFALVLTPTRELAFQIGQQFEALGKAINVSVTVITGGLDMMRQGQALAKKPHIVVATPGRLCDHIDSCDTFSLKRVKFLVIDEADRMLEDNFGPQLEIILKKLPASRQNLFFTASVSSTLTDLGNSVLKNPFMWHQDSERLTVEGLKEEYVMMAAHKKDAFLVHVLDRWTRDHPKSSVMIFASTCKYAELLGIMLRKMGFPCAVLHAMTPQRFRLASLSQFKSHQVRILVGTNLASRGLDIPSVDLIINYSIPDIPRIYVHRVGRTARGNRCGHSISLVSPFDVDRLKAIEEYTKNVMTEHPTDEAEVLEMMEEVNFRMREAAAKLDKEDFGEQKRINKRKSQLLEDRDPELEEELKRRKEVAASRSREEVKEAKKQRDEKYKARFARIKEQKKLRRNRQNPKKTEDAKAENSK